MAQDEGRDGFRGDAAPVVLDGNRLAGVLPRLGLAPFVWSAREDTLAWSEGAARILRLPEGTAPPATLRGYRRLLAPDCAERREGVFSLATVDERDRRDGVPYDLVCRLRGADGSGDAVVEVRESGRWWPDAQGMPARIEAVVSELGTVPAVCAEPPAVTNPATGFLQRDALFGRLRELIDRLLQERQGAAAFMVVAIDGLAEINASFGYEVGDRIIATVAQRISRRMRHADVIGHMSGHKFGLILHNCTESTLAVAAERFRRAVDDELVVTSTAEIQVTISMGAVVVPRNARDAETAAMRAEEALGEARDGAQDRTVVFHHSPERDQLRRRNLEIAEEIVHGLAEDRFMLAYQPVVDAVTWRIVSYEALTRLVRRDGSIISAGPLVVTAERLGLVRRIDQQALRLVLADLKDNRNLKLAVNVSAETLTDPMWLNQLVDHVSADRDISRRLTVEITETAAFRNPDQIRRMSETLRDIGCRVAIDDFGAGYTSMGALRQLEVDVLKIDGAYVRDVATNPDSVVFVRVLSDIARHFGIRTVAEWVQDEIAARRLADLGVDMLQGRHVGEPRLRVTALNAPILDRFPEPRVERESDGYAVSAGRLEGPLAVEGPMPSAITSPGPAGPAVAAWPRAAS